MGAQNGKRRRPSVDTEREILEAAADVFRTKGYFDATVADIVERTSVSRPTFYIYFSSKDDVFRKLIANAVDDLLTVRLPSDGVTYRDKVEGANRQYLIAFQRHRHLLRALFQMAAFDKELSLLHADLRRRSMARLERHLSRGVAAGLCPPMNTKAAAYALVSMVEWTSYLWAAADFDPWGEPMTLDDMVAELTDLWCRAVYREDVPGRKVEGQA
jgi:AcrR family transcriptional regulator